MRVPKNHIMYRDGILFVFITSVGKLLIGYYVGLVAKKFAANWRGGRSPRVRTIYLATWSHGMRSSFDNYRSVGYGSRLRGSHDKTTLSETVSNIEDTSKDARIRLEEICPPETRRSFSVEPNALASSAIKVWCPVSNANANCARL
jgi:hypothetical protein